MKISNLAEDAEDFTGNIWHLENSEDVLIDAGTGDSWEKISELEKIDKVVVTHSHYDHIDNLEKIVETFDPDIYAFEPGNLPVKAEELGEEDTVELCGEEFEVFHTPGHKDDSICLYSRESGKLFTGDLIFPEGGFGRTDLEEGDRGSLIASIEKISGLDMSSFYPGHEGAVEEYAEDWVQRALEEARKREPKY
jgi:glyoxylase-like metal-dependent hydrolase (beta-lactamase superfamily II)